MAPKPHKYLLTHSGVGAFVTVRQNQGRIHDGQRQKPEAAQAWIHSTQPAKAYGRDGWRTTAQLFLASVHGRAQVLFGEIAGVLFFKHFSWKAAFYSPMGVSHSSTASWRTAVGWQRLQARLRRLI